jgi:hypothetical protein
MAVTLAQAKLLIDDRWNRSGDAHSDDVDQLMPIRTERSDAGLSQLK